MRRMTRIIRRGPGEVWWQIKFIIGNDGNGQDVTPYSNVGSPPERASSNVKRVLQAVQEDAGEQPESPQQIPWSSQVRFNAIEAKRQLI